MENTTQLEQVSREESQLVEPAGDTQVALSCGYFVGKTRDGVVVFDTIGNTTGILELLGLNSYALHRINITVDTVQKTGYPMVLGQLASMAQKIQGLTAAVETLTNKSVVSDTE